MEKETIRKVITSFSSNPCWPKEACKLLDWLYENGYEIIKVKDSPKSKFMEEVEEKMTSFMVGKNDPFVAIEAIYKRLCTLTQLIDKYKMDK